MAESTRDRVVEALRRRGVIGAVGNPDYVGEVADVAAAALGITFTDEGEPRLITVEATWQKILPPAGNDPRLEVGKRYLLLPMRNQEQPDG